MFPGHPSTYVLIPEADGEPQFLFARSCLPEKYFRSHSSSLPPGLPQNQFKRASKAGFQNTISPHGFAGFMTIDEAAEVARLLGRSLPTPSQLARALAYLESEEPLYNEFLLRYDDKEAQQLRDDVLFSLAPRIEFLQGYVRYDSMCYHFGLENTRDLSDKVNLYNALPVGRHAISSERWMRDNIAGFPTAEAKKGRSDMEFSFTDDGRDLGVYWDASVNRLAIVSRHKAPLGAVRLVRHP